MKKTNKDKNAKPLVFISWGGSLLEQAKAEALQSFIESKLPISVFVSSRDIATCSVGWRSVIYKNLNQAKYGIVIISKENTSRPWIMYESGAMGMHLRFRNISLLSFDTISLEHNHPLEDKNMCFFNSDGIGRLLNDIENSLKLEPSLYNPNTDYIKLQELIKSRKEQLEKYERELMNSKDNLENNMDDIPKNIKESVVAEVTGKLIMSNGSSPYTGEIETIEINNKRITRPKTKKGACCVNKSGNIIKPLTQAAINRMAPALQSNIADAFKVVELMGKNPPIYSHKMIEFFRSLKEIESKIIPPKEVVDMMNNMRALCDVQRKFTNMQSWRDSIAKHAKLWENLSSPSTRPAGGK